jgi:hypothetical protein
MLQEGHEGEEIHETETQTQTQTQTQTRNQSNKARDRRNPNNSHREVEDEVGEGGGEGARPTLVDLRHPMLRHWSLSPRLYKKRRTGAEEVGVVGAEVGEEEEVQSASPSARLPAVVNLAAH